jgi:hypothetical protein
MARSTGVDHGARNRIGKFLLRREIYWEAGVRRGRASTAHG